MNEQYIMRPGDRFYAPECGCSFVVSAGPADAEMVRQAPQCCCGHSMIKSEFSGERLVNSAINSDRDTSVLLPGMAG